MACDRPGRLSRGRDAETGKEIVALQRVISYSASYLIVLRAPLVSRVRTTVAPWLSTPPFPLACRSGPLTVGNLSHDGGNLRPCSTVDGPLGSLRAQTRDRPIGSLTYQRGRRRNERPSGMTVHIGPQPHLTRDNDRRALGWCNALSEQRVLGSGSVVASKEHLTPPPGSPPGGCCFIKRDTMRTVGQILGEARRSQGLTVACALSALWRTVFAYRED